MAQCPHGLGSFSVLGLRLIEYLTQVLRKSLVLWRLLDGSGGRSIFSTGCGLPDVNKHIFLSFTRLH